MVNWSAKIWECHGDDRPVSECIRIFKQKSLAAFTFHLVKYQNNPKMSTKDWPSNINHIKVRYLNSRDFWFSLHLAKFYLCTLFVAKAGSPFHEPNLYKTVQGLPKQIFIFLSSNRKPTGLTGCPKTNFNCDFNFSVEQSVADRVHHLTSQISTKMVQGVPEKWKKFTTPVKWPITSKLITNTIHQ